MSAAADQPDHCVIITVPQQLRSYNIIWKRCFSCHPVCLCVSLHRRFQDMDRSQQEISKLAPLEVRVPHSEITNLPEFRVTSLEDVQ